MLSLPKNPPRSRPFELRPAVLTHFSFPTLACLTKCYYKRHKRYLKAVQRFRIDLLIHVARKIVFSVARVDTFGIRFRQSIDFHLTQYVNHIHLTEIRQSTAKLWPRRFSIWRPSAILNFKNLRVWSRDCHRVPNVLLCKKINQN